MDTTGTFEMAVALAKEKCVTAIHKHYTLDDWKQFAADHPEALEYVCISSGVSDGDFDMLTETVAAVPAVPFLCLDVANGYSEFFADFVHRVRENFPDHIIIAGNVCTREMTEELVLKGADIVKVGIGPGSVCTTRIKTGVGMPQLSAVLECGDGARGLGGRIVADGGCSVPGDVCKAFGAGGDFVMLGGMLSGHDECGGELVERNGRLFQEFYGMSSATAMKKYRGGVAGYRASEGKHVLVPYKGKVDHTMQDILGGLRSCCTYVGASQLKWLPKCTTFVRVTAQVNTVFNQFNTGWAEPGGKDYATAPPTEEEENGDSKEKES